MTETQVEDKLLVQFIADREMDIRAYSVYLECLKVNTIETPETEAEIALISKRLHDDTVLVNFLNSKNPK